MLEATKDLWIEIEATGGLVDIDLVKKVFDCFEKAVWFVVHGYFQSGMELASNVEVESVSRRNIMLECVKQILLLVTRMVGVGPDYIGPKTRFTFKVNCIIGISHLSTTWWPVVRRADTHK